MGGYIVHNGQVAISWSLYISSCYTAEYAEARAIYEGLKQFHFHGHGSSILYSDSQLLLHHHLTLQSLESRHEWCHILEASKDLLNIMLVHFVRMPRSYNRIADKLARSAMRTRTSVLWWGMLPPFCTQD